MKKLWIIPVLTSVLIIGACTDTRVSEKDTEAIFDILNKNPDKLLNVLEKAQEYQFKENMKEEWTHAEHKDINYNGMPVIGKGKDKVTFYYSYGCGYCAHVQELARKLAMNDTQVSLKIISDDDMAELAYSIFMELFNKDKNLGLAFNDMIFLNQGEFYQNHEKVIRMALEKLEQPFDLMTSVKGKYDEQIQINRAEFDKFGLRGTPTAIVNDIYPVMGLQDMETYKEAMSLK